MMRSKLINHLPRYFDADPEVTLAMKVTEPPGLAWSCANRTLTVTGDTGYAIGTYDLSSLTLTQLQAKLEADGCTVVVSDGMPGHLSADILLEGSGRQSETNGDRLYFYTSNLWALVDAYAVEVESADASIGKALLEAYLHSASGEWLNYWGEYFGVERISRWRMQYFTWSATLTWNTSNRKWGIGQDPLLDNPYSQMIVSDTVRPKSNPFAIESAIFDNIGVECRVREPWQDVARFDESRTDDRWHLYDANFWTWGVLQPIWSRHDRLSDVDRAMKILSRYRPIGTLIVHSGETPPPCSVLLAGGGPLSMSMIES
jgi:hypothetical protein